MDGFKAEIGVAHGVREWVGGGDDQEPRNLPLCKIVKGYPRSFSIMIDAAIDRPAGISNMRQITDDTK